MSLRVALYLRVSTGKQRDGMSLAVQRQGCERWCREQGASIVGVYEEAFSAKTATRPQLHRLRADARRHKFDVILVYEVDRWARDTFDGLGLLREVDKLGIKLACVNEPIEDSPDGEYSLTMKFASAKRDNQIRARKIKDGMNAHIEAGIWVTGSPPYGLRHLYDEKGRVLDELGVEQKEARWVHRTFELLESGTRSGASVRRQLTMEGMRTRKGGPFSVNSFCTLVRNAAYIGWYERSDGTHVRGQWPALVSESRFYKVQQNMTQRRARGVPHVKDRHEWPLKGTLIAPCGRPLSGFRNEPKKVAYMQCPCGCVRGRVEEVEAGFRDFLDSARPSPQLWAVLKATARKGRARAEAAAQARQAEVQKRLDALASKERALDDANFERRISFDKYHAYLGEIQAERRSLEAELREVAGHRVDMEAGLARAQYIIDHASRLWQRAPLDLKQALQAAYFPDGVVYTKRSGTRKVITGLTLSKNSYFQLPKGKKFGLVDQAGIEPATS
jgi:site-specific DNA recombinase